MILAILIAYAIHYNWAAKNAKWWIIFAEKERHNSSIYSNKDKRLTAREMRGHVICQKGEADHDKENDFGQE